MSHAGVSFHPNLGAQNGYALLIPQISWAADDPAAPLLTYTGLGLRGTVDLAGHEAVCSHYADLLELYRTGQLEYHAPGR